MAVSQIHPRLPAGTVADDVKSQGGASAKRCYATTVRPSRRANGPAAYVIVTASTPAEYARPMRADWRYLQIRLGHIASALSATPPIVIVEFA